MATRKEVEEFIENLSPEEVDELLAVQRKRRQDLALRDVGKHLSLLSAALHSAGLHQTAHRVVRIIEEVVKPTTPKENPNG